MYRVIVADDEHHVVDWIVDLLASNISSLEVQQAYNGLDVLKTAETRFFDIAILDIRMPGMDGIAVAKELLTRYPNIQIVLLTGCDEFDLIYQVNPIPNIQYLLKTESDAAIVAKVNNAIATIEQVRTRQQIMDEAAMQEMLLRHYEQRNILLDLIYENQSSSITPFRPDQYRTVLHLDLEQPLYITLLQFSSGGRKRHYFSNERLFQLYRILEDIIHPFFNFAMVDIDSTSALLLMQSEKKLETTNMINVLKTELDRSLQDYQRIYPDTIRFLVFHSAVKWDELYASVQLLTEALTLQCGRVQILDGQPNILGAVLDPNKIAGDALKPDSIRTLLNKHLPQALSAALYDHAPEQLYEIVADISSKPHTIGGIRKSEQVALRSKLSIIVLDFINQYHLEEQIRGTISLSPLYRAMDATDWQTYLTYLVRLIKVITETSLTEEYNNSKLLIRNIKAYIADHLSTDLSVTNLAEVFNYNPSYISRLFKQIEGTVLSQYIKTVRINKAKHLLRSTSLSVQSIADAVGFDTAQYFSMVFRKEVGVTPKTYRSAAP